MCGTIKFHGTNMNNRNNNNYFGYRTGTIIIFILNDNEQGLYYKNASKAESY